MKNIIKNNITLDDIMEHTMPGYPGKSKEKNILTLCSPGGSIKITQEVNHWTRNWEYYMKVKVTPFI